ncbi:MAG: hypothetical protein WA012_09405 [Rhodoferax sp.]|jgi:hypothetical protein
MAGGVVARRGSFHFPGDNQQNQAGDDAYQRNAANVYFPKITCEITHYFSNQVRGSILLERQVGSFIEVSRILAGVGPAKDSDESQKADHGDQ